MNTVNLNLARKWRSKNFDQIVGQELTVRILKNSLFLKQFFPVYLFAGQRGCGKTSTARVFAAAVNCLALADFQKNPKQFSIPCLTCTSCVAMANGQHPDFIEIDAASHTGVDNVRQIIDAASLLPVMGNKKIYLIDEAHMLSKAAFNAFLKILEEPPMGVLFILATTDTQKIIETVRSRSFQLFFKPVDESLLLNHLAHICTQENIRFEHEGLQVIIDQSEGSVRDALNILEQVRFATSIVSAASVRQALGHVDDEHLLDIIRLIVRGNQQQLVTFLNDKKLESYSAQFIFKRLVELVRIALWAKHGIAQQETVVTSSSFKKLLKECTWQQLYECLEFFYKNELIFQKTTAQQSFLEMILLQLCQKNNRNNNSGTAPLGQQPDAQPAQELDDSDEDDQEEDDDSDQPLDDSDDAGTADQWQQFLQQVRSLEEPLLDSLFSQALVKTALNQPVLEVSFPQDLGFFQEWLESMKKSWMPLLQSALPSVTDLIPVFDGQPTASVRQAKSAPRTSASPSSTATAKPAAAQAKPQQGYASGNKFQYPARAKAVTLSVGQKIDVSDKEIWKKTNLILRHFPGTVTQIKENA